MGLIFCTEMSPVMLSEITVSTQSKQITAPTNQKRSSDREGGEIRSNEERSEVIK